jgi:polyhydroxybutyrate depolymerase
MDARARGLYATSMRQSFLALVVGLSFSALACAPSSEIAAGGGSPTTTTGKGGGATTSSEGGGGEGGGSTTATGSEGGGGAGGAPVKCEGKTGTLGDWNMKLMSGGVERNADVHVPEKYDPTVPTSLVLNFHGFSSNSTQEALLSLMNDASDERGFVVVYPNGLYTSWNAGKCCGSAATLEVDDLAYVSALIDELAEQYCFDPKRVFATGMSNGGFLSNRLACELSDKVAAIAPVAGVIGLPLDDCQPPRPVPVMHFHGTLDTLVPYEGGGVYLFPSVDDSVARWREINGCGSTLEITYEQGDSQCVSPQGCEDGADVILCTVDGGGHTWPGGTPVPSLGWTTMDLDATNAMLDFFEKHPMP